MGFLSNINERIVNTLEGLRVTDSDDDYEDVEIVEREVPIKSRPYREPAGGVEMEQSNITHITPDVDKSIVKADIKTIDDAPEIVSHLKLNRICIINLEGVEIAGAQRIADFLGGASYAMNGSIERINENIFIMAPLGTSIQDWQVREIKSGKPLLSWITKPSKF